MDIKNIETANIRPAGSTKSLQKSNIQQQTKTKNVENSAKIQDKLQLSNEAKNLQFVKKKIETGFYKRPEITLQTATQIYRKNFKI